MYKPIPFDLEKFKILLRRELNLNLDHYGDAPHNLIDQIKRAGIKDYLARELEKVTLAHDKKVHYHPQEEEEQE